MPEDVNGSTQEPAAQPEGAAAAAEAGAAAAEEPEPEARPAPKRELAAASPKAEGGATSLDFILDLPLEVSVELGRATIAVGELLQLGQGSVVELNKLAGEPLEVLVNQKLVARGEAVVVNEKFGVRILDVVSAEERVRRLG